MAKIATGVIERIFDPKTGYGKHGQYCKEGCAKEHPYYFQNFTMGGNTFQITKSAMAPNLQQGRKVLFTYEEKTRGDYTNLQVEEFHETDNGADNLPWPTHSSAPTEEAKLAVTHEQPQKPSAPQYGWTSSKDEQIQWAQAVNLGASYASAWGGLAYTEWLAVANRVANMIYPVILKGPGQAIEAPEKEEPVQDTGKPVKTAPEGKYSGPEWISGMFRPVADAYPGLFCEGARTGGAILMPQLKTYLTAVLEYITAMEPRAWGKAYTSYADFAKDHKTTPRALTALLVGTEFGGGWIAQYQQHLLETGEPGPDESFEVEI